jgi:hypothetical protein
MTARISNTLTLTVAALVAAIGAGAFLLSYDALYSTGLSNGTPARWAWIWPLLIDLPLIVFTVAMLSAQLTRQSIKLWAGLVLLYTLATVAFNLSHAQPTPLGWLVAIVAPVGLLLTTEALRHLAKGTIERAAAVQSLAELSALLDTRRADLDKLNGQIEQAGVKLESLKADILACQTEQKHRSGSELTAAKLAKIAQRRDKVLELLSSGLSPADIAGELDVTVRTIKRDIRQLNGAAIEARGTL